MVLRRRVAYHFKNLCSRNTIYCIQYTAEMVLPRANRLGHSPLIYLPSLLFSSVGSCRVFPPRSFRALFADHLFPFFLLVCNMVKLNLILSLMKPINLLLHCRGVCQVCRPWSPLSYYDCISYAQIFETQHPTEYLHANQFEFPQWP